MVPTSWSPVDAPLGISDVCWHDDHATLRPTARAPLKHVLCLVPGSVVDGKGKWRGDYVSVVADREGRWPDCEVLPLLWQRIGALLGPSAGSLFIDVGANIGMCSLEMLAATDANVLSLEPNHRALWHLTSALKRWTHQSGNSAASQARVNVLPAAAGSRMTHARIDVQLSNLGNSMLVGRRLETQNYSVPVLPLDTLVPPSRGRVRLIKIDVQGRECAVLEGARRVLEQTECIVAEADDNFLRGHGCSVAKMRASLHDAGFSLRGYHVWLRNITTSQGHGRVPGPEKEILRGDPMLIGCKRASSSILASLVDSTHYLTVANRSIQAGLY